MSKHEKKILKCAQFCISKDETRPYLMGFYNCFDHKALITTDDHKLFYSKQLYQSELSEKIIDPLRMKIIDREYPRVSAVIPDMSKLKKILVTLDKRYYVKSKRLSNLFFRPDGSLVLFDKPDDAIFCLDSNNLGPLADGTTYEVFYRDDKSPVVFNLSRKGYPVDQFMIIMPVRM